jgi:uncharacterized DUF497 family protein
VYDSTQARDGFEWDPRKAAANVPKHGVRFADAIQVLEDERAVTVVDKGHDRDGSFSASSGCGLHMAARANSDRFDTAG